MRKFLEYMIDVCWGVTGALVFLIIVMLMSGCEEVDARSNEDRCKAYSAEYTALSACERAYDCRLNDNRYYRMQFLFSETIEACMLSGGETDRDVQPPEEDLSDRT